jgi:hypothetical protein
VTTAIAIPGDAAVIALGVSLEFVEFGIAPGQPSNPSALPGSVMTHYDETGDGLPEFYCPISRSHPITDPGNQYIMEGIVGASNKAGTRALQLRLTYPEFATGKYVVTQIRASLGYITSGTPPSTRFIRSNMGAGMAMPVFVDADETVFNPGTGLYETHLGGAVFGIGGVSIGAQEFPQCYDLTFGGTTLNSLSGYGEDYCMAQASFSIVPT